MTQSYPLHRPVNSPKQITDLQPAHVTIMDSAATSDAAVAYPLPTIDMMLLVIASDGNEANLPAIKQALDYLGTPYTVYVAAKTPGCLVPDKLGNEQHGYYQGIILTNGTLSYYNGTSYVSALTQQEWNNLWTYEANLGVRELSWYTYPTSDFGYQPVTGVVDTTDQPIEATLTVAAQTTFFQYMNVDTTITIRYTYAYLAKPLTDGATTPFLSDINGNALAAVRSYADGRQTLSLTFDSNPNLIHSIVLSYGLINWLTKGLFLGERHVYMSAQIDDLFIDDSNWLKTTACETPVDDTGATFRMTGTDFEATINWQNTKRVQRVSANTTLTLAFNGQGIEDDISDLDTLTVTARKNEDQFYWVNHTYTHANLDDVDYATAMLEIILNNQVEANDLCLTYYSTLNMVTPDVSGLTNAVFLQAAYDNGIRYLVSDTSVEGYNNPSPNAGIYNSYQPAILMIPRRPNNLFYNVSTPEGWVKEYNCIYHTFWGRNLSYQEILDIESDTLVTYLFKGDIDPWMFHQPNLHAYDGIHTLLGDLLDLTLHKYAQYYNLVIVNATMDDLGSRIANRMHYNAAAVTASIVPDVSITLTAQKAVIVPVTGLYTENAEFYGEQYISYMSLNAGQSVTVSLQSVETFPKSTVGKLKSRNANTRPSVKHA